MAELLFELGAEELPARFVVPALEDLQRVFKEKCLAVGLTHGAVHTYGTPRRLALQVHDVLERTPDLKKDVQGPSVKAAFDEKGEPRVPAVKFAESVGLKVSDLKRVTTPKGEYLTASVEEKGRRAVELLPEVLTACIKGINFPKSMRWGDVDLAFGRPLHWIVALLGAEVVPVVFADVKSGRVTRGHRFLAPQWVSIEKPADYLAVLEKAHVLADLGRRRALLVERVEALAKKAGGTLIKDEALVDQVLNLVELPNPVLGAFEARHLDLPAEVLIQEMKSHQRYFSLQGPDGRLLPKFIAVSNTPVKDEKLSVAGYERVLKARLTDGRFFFDEDRRQKLADRQVRLNRRTWVGALGNIAEKSARIGSLATWLSAALGKGALDATLERAAALCKCDLETGMVGEFPELQGVMGREYARHDGETPEVALAIFEHYLPRGATDSLPTQDAGALLGLADRLDSLAGLFGIGKKPTGAKDEYALRRACLAVINVTIARGYRYSLAAALEKALAQVEPKFKDVKRKAGEPPVKDQLQEFFRGRLEALWREKHRPDLVDAVLASGFDDLVATQRRLTALTAAAGQKDFSALAATFKRVGNIVEKQAKDITRAPVDAGRLTDAAEKALHTQLTEVQRSFAAAIQADDYALALGKVVPLRGAVDTFFEKVMVMAEDKGLRENRVRLLMEIGALFGQVADFSRIQAES